MPNKAVNRSGGLGVFTNHRFLAAARLPWSCGQETQSIAMPKMNRQQGEPHVTYHKNGSVWAKGFMLDGEMVGYWEWFRLDGSRMRSGSFIGGQQSGLWTTYEADGRVVKVTDMDMKGLKAAGSATSKRKDNL